ncbi:unnamed protein product [Onchocerca ochengi]|uniref:C-type lectin domain-containing protein n=1 Tax=Onchocerca ochengi TaxID=42157 RepID=A0A182EFS0_ONCOC|nr:unnamed protein product [Onchocerca ochengi]
MIILIIGNNNLAKTNISPKDDNKALSKDSKLSDVKDSKKKDPESSTGKKSTLGSLKKIRNLLNISLKIRKGKEIPKPLERLEESIIEDGKLEKEPEKQSEKLQMKSSSSNQRNKSTTGGISSAKSIFALDKTQSDATVQGFQPAKQILPLSNEFGNLSIEDQTQGTALLETPVKYDPKILVVKMKRRIRRYAKISFCIASIILSIIFIISIIAMFGWWLSFSALSMLNFERSIRFTNNWESDEHSLLARLNNTSISNAKCNYRNLSTSPWTSWTECLRSDTQSVQWRWRNLSSGLYFVDQSFINFKWC